MFRSLLIAVASTALFASIAAADAPHSLGKGHWSLGYEADSDPTIQFGIGIADMTRIIASIAIENSDPGGTASSTTAFGVSGEFRRYLSGMSSNYFSPFLGAGAGVTDTGIDGQDSNIDVFGGFGGEAFVVEPLSIGGFVGFGYTKHGDFTDPNDPNVTIPGEKTFGTLRSAITATLYWGSSNSPQ